MRLTAAKLVPLVTLAVLALAPAARAVDLPPGVGAPVGGSGPPAGTAGAGAGAGVGAAAGASSTSRRKTGAEPEAPTGSAAADVGRTPLAGDRYETQIFGQDIVVPFRDPRNVNAIQLGATFYSPPIGDTGFLPFGAFYMRRSTEDDWRRFRMTFTGIVNDIEFADGTWNDYGVEALARWENDTVPLPRGEIDRGHYLEYTEMYWGQMIGGLGIGWRTPVAPAHFDNDFRVQLFYEPGYFYAMRSEKTADAWVLPKDTFFQRLHFRLRYDGYDRNLLELLHEGYGFGFDAIGGWRDHWHDFGIPPSAVFEGKETRDYLRLLAYANAAVGIPGLSERHRIVATWAGGWAPAGNLDRHSAFRLGGGPPISETYDLWRNPFPGALFDQLLSERFTIAAIEYRYELLFFMFLHLRATAAWARLFSFSGVPPAEVKLLHRDENEQSISAGISSGFVANSMIYVEYSYTTGGVIREDPGHGVLLSWTFSF